MGLEVSENYLINAIKMMRQKYTGTIVIVEGPHDKDVYQNFVKRDKCQIMVAHKRDNAIHAINQLNRDCYRGIIAILDADFSWLEGRENHEPNVVITDNHDLYTMILSSNSLEKLKNTFCDEEEIQKLSLPLDKFLLDRSSIIGIFRWLSSPNQKNYRLMFRTLNINDCINKNTLDILIDNLIRIVISESRRQDLDPDKIKREILRMDITKFDLWDLCQGHELVKIFHIGLKNKFRNKTGKRIDFPNFEICFRLSYEFGIFNETRLYKLIKKWEREVHNFSFYLINVF